MDGSDGIGAGGGKNISGTIARPQAPCGYVVAGAGLGAQFCDRPALGRGSYCAEHAARCCVKPGSPAAVPIIAALERDAAAPSDDPAAAPEPLEATEPHELALALAVPEDAP